MQGNIKIRPTSTLTPLLEFLEQDPTNTTLLAGAAAQAFEAGEFDLTSELIGRHGELKPLPLGLQNLQGLVAIKKKKYDDAIDVLSELRGTEAESPALRFNLAWAHAMKGEWPQALELLDDDSLATSPHAPALKIQMLHHLTRLEDALACGQALSKRFPDNQALMGTLASVAIDAEKPDLALQYAKRAGDNAEGPAAHGILSLGEQDISGSLAAFETALRKDPANPRALVGKGLSLLVSGDMDEGAVALDRGAERFRTHIGSWVAAGWAHFIMQDYPTARLRFEKALALDPNFSETHGGLAVLNIVDGKWDQAARECEIALRLDKNCFGAALAKSLLLQHRGHPQIARKVLDVAMSTPVGPKGQTLAQMLAGLGARSR